MPGNTIEAISAERYCELIAKLGLSQRAAARFLGIAERTSRRYASGESLVDPRTGMLLEIMAKYKITPEQALRLIGVDVRTAAKEAAADGRAPRYFEE
jgi:transcriptional regulator with XRE-family HTH domain